LKSLLLSATLLLAYAGAAVADCSKLNSSDFLESTPWDQVIDCVEKSPEMVGRTDDRGFNLLMTAIASDIGPMQLDELFSLVPEDLADDVIEAIDLQGRSIAHIAASEALDPAFIFVLSSNGVSLSEEIDDDHNPARSGQTPLHFAAQREDGWLFVAALLALRNEVLEDDREKTAFDIAASKEMIGPDTLLLAEGEWPSIFTEQFDPAQPTENAVCGEFLTGQFFARAQEGDIAACLKDENQLFSVDREGNSILHLAALNAEDPWIIDAILRRAEDPDTLLEKRNSSGKTPLHLAAEGGKSAEVLLHLLAWGADPDTLFNAATKLLGKNRGISALHMAASRKDDLREIMVLILLAFQADTMIQDTAFGDAGSGTSGRTALHRAIIAPDPFVMLMLLEGQAWQENLVAYVARSFMGKSVKQISDDSGRTALHIASSRPSDFDTLLLLVSYGFSVDQKDNQNSTPLMFAARDFTDAENFLFLLENSRQPCGTSKTGVTVEAALLSNKALMEIGADDTSGNTLSPLALLKQRCR
jgi:ankyrin repeat protein